MRKKISMILALAFILVSITGIELSFGSKPPMAQSQSDQNKTVNTNSEKVRQKSFYPKVAHEWGGYLFIVAGLTHLVLNIKPMKSYLKLKS